MRRTICFTLVLALVAATGFAAQRTRTPAPITPEKGDEAEISSHIPEAIPIPDDGYDGTLGSMACIDVAGINVTISDLDVQVAISHTFAGDLVIKLVNPADEVLTLASRPGFAEPADDGTSGPGDSSNLSIASPILFDDAAATSAENMGSTIDTDGVICADDGECAFSPYPDTGPGTNLAQFNGQNGAGTWQVCVGDSAGLDTGDFDSAMLVFNGLDGDLEVSLDVPGGVTVDDPFAYQITATNNGPLDQSGVVITDTLPADLAYVSDDCGGSAAGQTWTWNVGALANGASATCNLMVDLTSPSCILVSNSVAATGSAADLDTSNNTASFLNGLGEQVQDPSFEAGTPNPYWAEASTQFGTPLCNPVACNPLDVPPTTGDWWVFFGGENGLEEGSVEQSVTIPPGAVLSFQFVIPISSANGTDVMRVLVDGTELFSALENDPTYTGSAYQQVVLDLTDFDDGGTHSLRIESTCNQPAGQSTFFFVDDVSIDTPTCGAVVARAEVPTLSLLGALMLGILLAAAGIFLVRRLV
jgi:uncharacterized repeat protein (TIGR01451 family)